MNVSLLTDLVLAFGTSFFTAQGDTQTAATLRKLQAAKAAGANVEWHMQQVADALLNDQPLDWEELDKEITAEVDEFLARSG